MAEQDIRWKQRFDNYKKALQNLNDAVELMNDRPLSKLEKQGLIQSFEFTHELSWKVMKDFLEFNGVDGIMGSRDTFRIAFNNGLIEDGELWIKTIADRNLSSHTYDETTANNLAEKICKEYAGIFNAFLEKMKAYE